MTIAKYYILSRALEDKYLSHQEVNEIMGSLFDESNPTTQVNTTDYLHLKETIINYQQAAAKDKSWEIQYEDKTDAQKVSYLLKNFPGNLEHYRSVLAKNGLSNVTVPEDLPVIEINYFEQDPNQNSIFRVDFSLDGTNYIFDVDTTFTFATQGFLKEDPLNGAIFADVMTSLMNLYQTSFLSDNETGQFSSLMAYLSPYPNPAMDLTSMLQKLGLLSGPETNFLMAPLSTDRGQKVESSFQIPLRADSSIQTLKLTQVLAQVREIVGDEILNVLKDHGIQMGFFDFKDILSEHQTKDLFRAHSSFDMVAIGAGLYAHEIKNILIDTNYPVNAMVLATIHEIGHALNFLIQDQSNLAPFYVEGSETINSPDAVHGYQITGAQRNLFLITMRQKNRWSNLPSAYGGSNQAEWFAEIFTHYMLEKTGRSDLLKERIDYNPLSLQSLFVIDPIAYLLVDKIVDTVSHRNQDSKSFSDLLEKGINWNFITGVDNYFLAPSQTISGKDVWSKVLSERSLNPNTPSISLQLFVNEWKTRPLSQIYATQTEEKYTLEMLIQDDFKLFSSFYTKKNPYLPDKHSNYEMKEFVERLVDAKAIQIVCEMKWQAKTKEDKIQVLLKNKIINQQALDAFCAQLTILNPEEVSAALNPNDLISEVALAYEQSAGDQK